MKKLFFDICIFAVVTGGAVYFLYSFTLRLLLGIFRFVSTTHPLLLACGCVIALLLGFVLWVIWDERRYAKRITKES